MSTINVLGPVGFNPTGPYDATRTYQKLDVVTYQGSSYVAKSDSIGQTPGDNTEYWLRLAAGGLGYDDIIDNLTSTASNKVLSAKQGKVLKDLVDDNADDISTLNSEVASLASGSPKGVYDTVSDLTTADPDHDNIYVVLADGKWYYYDGDNWTAGGIYQSVLNDFDYSLNENNKVPNSKNVGIKLNDNVVIYNKFNYSDITDNYYLDSSGNLVAGNDMLISNFIEAKQGDIIYLQNNITSCNISHISKFTNMGVFVERITVNSSRYTIQSTGLYKLNINKTNISDLTKVTLSVNRPLFEVVPYKYELANQDRLNTINDVASENKVQVNYFNYEKSLLNRILSNGGVIDATTYNTYFTTNIMPCSNGDVFKIKNLNGNNSTFAHGLKYDSDGHFVERFSISDTSYTSNFNGYIAFNCTKNSSEDISKAIVISKSLNVNKYYQYGLINKDDVEITKQNSKQFKIRFGDFKIILFKTENNNIKANNWNIKTLTNIGNQVIIPEGTDILGPILVNTVYLGGVHGYETTDYITLTCDHKTFDLTDIGYISGNDIKLLIKSSIYDNITNNKIFDRYMTLIFSKNKLHVWNSYKAVSDITIKRACNGGLFACHNSIINNIIFNNSYFSEPPTSAVDNASKYNTTATINTIYGSVTLNNLKGYENENYDGHIHLFTDEVQLRTKIYFDVLKQGNYTILQNQVINGEFEYILN